MLSLMVWRTSTPKAGVPALLGGALDHVVVTAAQWRVLSYSEAPLPGSDHRAVLVRLQRR